MRGQGRVFRPKVRGAETRVWWLDYSVRGERFRESSETTSRKGAQRPLRQRLDGRETGKLTGAPDRVLFPQLRELVERQYALDGRRSVWRITLAFDHLETFFGTDRAMDVTPARVDAYVEARLAEEAAPATINRELAALRRGFRLAVKKGVLATRPEFTMLQEHNARIGFLEAEDAAALFAELPDDVRPVAQFLVLTGWRKSEVLSLTWAQVDFTAGMLRLDVGTTKSGEGRTFPFGVLPDLEALLCERWTQRDGLFVFHRRGQRIKDFYAAWHGAVRRAAVRQVDGREVVVRPGLLGRIPHDCRRTAVRNLVRAGVSEHTAMKLSGHRTRHVFDRYDIVNERNLTEGIERLAALHANGKQAANIRPPAASSWRVTSSVA
jgi:integrase